MAATQFCGCVQRIVAGQQVAVAGQAAGNKHRGPFGWCLLFCTSQEPLRTHPCCLTGVKWSQVQILSARRVFMQVKGGFRGVPIGSGPRSVPTV